MTNKNTRKTEALAIRMSKEDKSKIEANASKYGFVNLSDYIRITALNAELKIKVK